MQPKQFAQMTGYNFPKFNVREHITSNNRKPTKGRYWKIQLINRKYTNQDKTEFKESKVSRRVLHINN